MGREGGGGGWMLSLLYSGDRFKEFSMLQVKADQFQLSNNLSKEVMTSVTVFNWIYDLY